ncbi:MAG: choice-of-anchor L domain-containing protein [Myxococcales bacterium]|nr:choice-of-anchor L domain-containing protein [Myxococcales bacterium]
MRSPVFPSLVLVSTALVATSFACSSSRESGFEDGSSSGSSGTSSGSSGFGGTDGGGSSGGLPCIPDPKNAEIPGNGCDDDGDGVVDNAPSCDDSLAEAGSAEEFARALGICTKASDKGYGLVSATFTRGYNDTGAPKAEQHGVLPKFGNVIVPREGKRIGVLSTGYAKEFNGNGQQPFGGVLCTNPPCDLFNPPQINGKDWWGPIGAPKFTLPPDYPKPAGNCPINKTVKDVINLKLELKAPQNAKGIKFDFNFYSGEWPAYICSDFNDGFIAYLKAKGFNNGTADNISFDKDKNPVSVNNGFFDRCTPAVKTGCAGKTQKDSVCPGGVAELEGTGFGQNGKWCDAFDPPQGGPQQSTNGGATGWLQSQAPVEPGETFTLEFIIWDTGDGVLDSSVLLDNFQWAEGAVTTGTVRPPR